MTADEMAIRVERSYLEMVQRNPNITIEEAKANVEMPDYTDANHAISPLRKADDAVVLDNTCLTIEEQLKMALQIADERINQRK